MKKLLLNTRLKYERIIDEWFINEFNGAQAYRKYFPHTKKASSAEVGFSRIQTFPEIKEYIKAKHKKVSKVVEMTHEGILQELKNWLELDITETIGLSVAEIKLLPIEIRRAFTEHKVSTKSFYNNKGDLISTEENIHMKFISKERAAEMINKHLGFYEKDNTQKGNDISIFTANEKHMSIVERILKGDE